MELPQYVTMELLCKHVVPWNERTVRRKILAEDFPASKDSGGRYMFNRSEVDRWFKRRQVQAG